MIKQRTALRGRRGSAAGEERGTAEADRQDQGCRDPRRRRQVVAPGRRLVRHHRQLRTQQLDRQRGSREDPGRPGRESHPIAIRQDVPLEGELTSTTVL